MYKSQERTKLDPKSRRCTFLGYADGVKGYRLWDLTVRKVIVSKDVIFAEGELQYKDDNTSKKTTTVHIVDESRKDISYEAEPQQEEQDPERVNDTQLRRSHRQTRKPSWHSDYVMASHDVYCLLTEEGEP